MKVPSIKIDWTDTAPAPHEYKWHRWAESHTSHAMDNNLGWPPGTVSILNQAFSLGLTRTHGWDLSHISPKHIKPYQAAATIFRRGVPWRQGQEYSVTSGRSGQYHIDFIPTIKNIFDGYPTQNHFLVLDKSLKRRLPQAALKYPSIDLKLDENQKSLQAISSLQQEWKKTGSLNHWLIAGGGLLSDLAAMTAALNHCTFTLIPTTLLAMADACVGGKTGINFAPHGKNQLGIFSFPQRVIVCQEWLHSLPKQELKAGLSECLKHAFLSGDRQLCQGLTQAGEKNDLNAITKLLPEVIQFKADIIAMDPTERGIRSILNFGHTLAHALESISHKHSVAPLLHGQAVALGMIFASILSENLASLSHDDSSLIKSCVILSGCLDQVHLSTSLGMDIKDSRLIHMIIDLIKQDKKMIASTKTSQWVLLTQLGKIYEPQHQTFTTDVSDTLIIESWNRLLQVKNIIF